MKIMTSSQLLMKVYESHTVYKTGLYKAEHGILISFYKKRFFVLGLNYTSAYALVQF